MADTVVVHAVQRLLGGCAISRGHLLQNGQCRAGQPARLTQLTQGEGAASH